VSLVTIGTLALPFCFFSLGRIVNWLILVQIASQMVWQCAGVLLLTRDRADIAQPFVMWLYPAPALVALTLWLYVCLSAPAAGVLFAALFLTAGLAAYAVFAGVGRGGSP
jgi:fructoselysine transporter